MRCKLSSYRRSNRDVGPCAHVGCSERARYMIDLLVEGCDVQTWACESHARPFGVLPPNPPVTVAQSQA